MRILFVHKINNNITIQQFRLFPVSFWHAFLKLPWRVEPLCMVAERVQRTANRKKHLQIKETTSSIWQRTCCKCSQHNQKRNALQIEKNTCKLRKHFRQFDNAHTANAHNTTKKRNVLQIEKNTCKLRKHFRQFDNAHAANAHNTTKKETRCK